MSKKILIIKPTALGDIAHASLVLPGIKKRQPDWHISWVVDTDYVSLLKLCPGIDEVIPFPRKDWRWRWPVGEILQWTTALRKKEFDITLDLQGLARSAWMTWAAGAKRRIGLHSAREMAFLTYTEQVNDTAVHAVDRYRQAVEHLVGKIPADELHYLQAPAPYPELDGRKYIVLHPYSLWQTKLWPWEYYSRLANALFQETFVFVGHGPFFPISAPNIIDLRNQTNLMGLLSILGHAESVISTDSGPAHLAAALGKPVISLFGATDPSRTAPRVHKGEILYADIVCRPCLKRICSHSIPMACMEHIGVERVVKSILALKENC